MLLRANSSAGVAETFYGMPGLFGTALPGAPTATLRLAVAEPLNACPAGDAQKLSVQHGAHTALIAVRGNCSFADKARTAQQAGAELLIVYNSQPGELVQCTHRLAMSRVNLDGLPAAACQAVVAQPDRCTVVTASQSTSLRLPFLY